MEHRKEKKLFYFNWEDWFIFLYYYLFCYFFSVGSWLFIYSIIMHQICNWQLYEKFLLLLKSTDLYKDIYKDIGGSQ